jgi:hypothetical protein
VFHGIPLFKQQSKLCQKMFKHLISAIYQKNSGNGTLNALIGGVDRFFSIDEEAAAAAASQVERFMAAQSRQYLGLLLQGGPFGNTWPAPFYNQYNELTFKRIAHGCSGVPTTQVVEKHPLFALSD